MFNWYKKEKPFQGMVGYGGGATGLRNAGLLGTPFDTEWLVVAGGGVGANGFGSVSYTHLTLPTILLV